MATKRYTKPNGVIVEIDSVAIAEQAARDWQKYSVLRRRFSDVRAYEAELMLQAAGVPEPAGSRLGAPAAEQTLCTNSNYPIEDRAKVEWTAYPHLRAEFRDRFPVYLSYRQALEAGRLTVV